MRRVFSWLTLLARLAFLPALGSCGKNDEPFYMKDLASLRQLPEEDLLRMRDDILAKAAKLPDQRVEENPPTGVKLAEAPLVPTRDRATSGNVRVWERSNGKMVICLENFRIPRAPDSRAEVAGPAGEFRDLGPLWGNVGRQCFEVPAGLEIARVRIRSVIFDETLAEARFGRP